MNKLTTSKYYAQDGSYRPIITDKIDLRTSKLIIEHFASKPPSEGFFRHQLVISDEHINELREGWEPANPDQAKGEKIAIKESTLFFFSVCADIVGFINANHRKN
jgi:hypothetical protein